MLYYEINPYGDGAKTAERWWNAHFTRFSCGHYDDNRKFFEEITVEYADDSCAVGSVLSSMPYLRLDFLDALCPEIEQAEQVRFDILIDNETRKVLDQWETVWMPSVKKRGSKKSFFWKCEVCGRRNYSFSLPCNYVLEEDAGERPIIMTDGAFLLLREDIHARLLKHPHWAKIKKKIRFNKVKVLQEPLDGYPADLSQYDPVVVNPNEFAIGTYGFTGSQVLQRIKDKHEKGIDYESFKLNFH